MTPRFTLTFGLGWTLEMPPTEDSGKQVIFVGPDNNPISTEQYLNARSAAALQGMSSTRRSASPSWATPPTHPSILTTRSTVSGARV